MMRLWVRLHCRAVPPGDDDVARELHAYVQQRLPHAEPALALSGAQVERDEFLGNHRNRLGEASRGDARERQAVSFSSAALAAACAASFLLRPSARAMALPPIRTSTTNWRRCGGPISSARR